MSIDLDRDVTINGHTFSAGKGVDTKATDTVDGKTVTTDYADSIKDVLKGAQDADAANQAAIDTDPLQATKEMKGVDQPNPVTERAASTTENDTVSAVNLDSNNKGAK